MRENEAVKLARYKALTFLRRDLEKVRELTDLVRKREMEKLKSLLSVRSYLHLYFTPLSHILTVGLLQLKRFKRAVLANSPARRDRNGFFQHAVDASAVPDYYDIIKYPMTFDGVEKKLKCHEYDTVDDFEVHLPSHLLIHA